MLTATEGAQDIMHDACFYVHAFASASVLRFACKKSARCATCMMLVSACMRSQTHPCSLQAFANACARALGCKMPEHQRSIGPDRSCTRMHANACERMRAMHACQRVRARSAPCAMHARSMNSWLRCCAHVASMCSLSLSLPVFLLLSQWLQDPPQAARSGGQACARAQIWESFFGLPNTVPTPILLIVL